MYAIAGKRSLSDAVGRRSTDPSCGTIYRQITLPGEFVSNIVFGFCFGIPPRVERGLQARDQIVDRPAC